MPTVNSQNFTTLYSATAQEIVPAEPYGNANVEAFLNIGTDGGNTVQNILANGEIVANGNITTNDFFVGDGGYLSNITAYSNVFANLANYANYAGNVTNSAQPNITSVGTLVNVTVTGNITSVSGIFNGDGSGLSNINVSNITGNANFANYAGNLINGNSNVNVAANGNVTFGINGTPNVLVVTSDGNSNGGWTYNNGNFLVQQPANVTSTLIGFRPEGRPIGTFSGGNLCVFNTFDYGLNGSGANPGIWEFIKLRGNSTNPAPAQNNDITMRLFTSVITPTSNVTSGANIPHVGGIQFTAPSAGNSSFYSSTWTPGQMRLRTGSGWGNVANLLSFSNYNTFLLDENGRAGVFQAAPSGRTAQQQFGVQMYGYDTPAMSFNKTGGNAEANAVITAGSQLGEFRFMGATNTPPVGQAPAYVVTANIWANASTSAVFTSGQTFATDLFLQATGGNINLRANVPSNDSANGSINLATQGTGQVVINSNVTRLTGQMVFANNTQSPDILVSNNASNSATRQLSLQAGNLDYTGVASNQTAGSLRMNSGNSDGSGSATTWIARGGGQILQAGLATSNIGNAIGGTYNIFGGDATSLLTGNVTGGAFLITGGSGTANVGNARSADMVFLGGGAYTETGESQGANIVITSGVATSNTSGNAVAGSIYIDTQPATGVTSSTQGNIDIGTGNSVAINIGNISNTSLSFYPYTSAVPGTSNNVSLLTTGANYRVAGAKYITNWNYNIDNIDFSEKYYGNDINTNTTIYAGQTTFLGYGAPGSSLVPSYFTVQVYETTSDLNNPSTGTGTSLQVGQGGLTAIVGSQTSAPAIGTFIYGNTTQSQASAIRINRRRGNSDVRSNVAGSDYLGNIEWRGSGSATGSLNSKIVTFGAKVDSSYGGPGNVMPIGFEMDVVNSSNAFIAHNFYANGDVSFSGGNSVIYSNGNAEFNNLASDNVSINTNGFMKLASYTAAGLNAITGQIGWMAAVSDSAGGGNPNGMIAFWDTTNARWSYVHDNSAV